MNVDMPKNLTYAFCTTDGGTALVVEKSRYAAESFNAELETDNRSRIGLETWGDNNAKGDIKVDNKVDNNVGDDTVKHPQPRTRTTTPYNTRTTSVTATRRNSVQQPYPYKIRAMLVADTITVTRDA